MAGAAIPSDPGVFNIRGFGAAGDGKTADTGAINRAIRACAEAGGGQVRFPPGRFLSGTIHLKSRVTLLFDAGSVLVGTTKLGDYQNFTPPPDTPEGKWFRWHRALILGDGVEEITIAGQGVIDGNKVFDARGEERMRGPHTILLGNCRNVVIRDLTIRDSANYAILLEFCRDVDIRDMKFTGGWDGVHFRGWPGRHCRNVNITGCRFFTGDDAIAGRYWENVLINSCIVNSSCNGIRLIGPAEHLTIQDCLFYGPGVHPHRTSKRHNMLAGINLQPGAWDPTEGSLDDVLISDITMKNVATPFHFTLKRGNTAGSITVSRVTATGVYRAASSVESWAGNPFTNVVFRDVSIQYEGGGTAEQGREPVKRVGVDPRELPAWGFYARNVKNLTLEDVRLGYAREDLRPLMICEDLERLTLDNLRFPRPAGAADLLLMKNVRRVQVERSSTGTVRPILDDVQLVSGDPSGRFLTGKPFTIRVAAHEGDGREGLAGVDLTVGNKTTSRWVWFRPGGKREVLFKVLKAPAPGTHLVKVGDLTRELVVEP